MAGLHYVRFVVFFAAQRCLSLVRIFVQSD